MPCFDACQLTTIPRLSEAPAIRVRVTTEATSSQTHLTVYHANMKQQARAPTHPSIRRR